MPGASEANFVIPMLQPLAIRLALPRPGLRRAATVVSLAVALWLRLRDYTYHVDTLQL